jgi:hypothetical protein
MKNLIQFILVLSLTLTGCASKPDMPAIAPPAPTPENPAGGCSEPWCVGFFVLIYGVAASVHYISYGIHELAKATNLGSVNDAIVLHCQIQTKTQEYVTPCGPFTVDMQENDSGKSRTYKFNGYDNQIRLLKGFNRLKITVAACDLSQTAFNVKASDVVQLEFPPECKAL